MRDERLIRLAGAYSQFPIDTDPLTPDTHLVPHRPMPMTSLPYLLALAVVTACVVSSAPCFCAEQEAPVVAEESDDAHSCCAGYTEEPESSHEDDCPHCASGTCDGIAMATNDAPSFMAAAATLAVASPVWVQTAGPPPAPLWVEEARPPDRASAEPVVSAAPVRAAIQVFRC